jgi:metallo-beta-lactamase family protein
MDGADYLVVESSTYGDRLHQRSDVMRQLADVINRTDARGGVVVIPAFAVGRAQTLLHCIHLLKAGRAIQDLPVYLNSPMAATATQVFRRHVNELRITPAEYEAMARGGADRRDARGIATAQCAPRSDDYHRRQRHGHRRARGAPPQGLRA